MNGMTVRESFEALWDGRPPKTLIRDALAVLRLKSGAKIDKPRDLRKLLQKAAERELARIVADARRTLKQGDAVTRLREASEAVQPRVEPLSAEEMAALEKVLG